MSCLAMIRSQIDGRAGYRLARHMYRRARCRYRQKGMSHCLRLSSCMSSTTRVADVVDVPAQRAWGWDHRGDEDAQRRSGSEWHHESGQSASFPETVVPSWRGTRLIRSYTPSNTLPGNLHSMYSRRSCTLATSYLVAALSLTHMHLWV